MLSKTLVLKLIVLILTVKLNLVSGLDKRFCTCKMKNTFNIIGGNLITNNKLPWMGIVTKNYKRSIPQHLRKDHCTAFLLNERFVMTTKNCAREREQENVMYSVGFGYDMARILRSTISVENVIHHPDRDVDLSLLELSQDIQFSDNLRPVCLDTNLYAQTKKHNQNLLAAGFGMTVPFIQDKVSNQILYYNIMTDSYEEQKDSVYSTYLKEVTMQDASDDSHCPYPWLCAVSSSELNTVCEGDQGGPLHYTHEGKTFAVGILSSLFESDTNQYKKYCQTYSGAYYHKISNYISWIEEHLGDGNYCDDNESAPNLHRSESIRIFGQDIEVNEGSSSKQNKKRRKFLG